MASFNQPGRAVHNNAAMTSRTRSRISGNVGSESERRRVKRGLPPQRQPGEGRPAADLDEGDDDRFDGVEV